MFRCDRKNYTHGSYYNSQVRQRITICTQHVQASCKHQIDYTKLDQVNITYSANRMTLCLYCHGLIMYCIHRLSLDGQKFSTKYRNKERVIPNLKLFSVVICQYFYQVIQSSQSKRQQIYRPVTRLFICMQRFIYLSLFLCRSLDEMISLNAAEI